MWWLIVLYFIIFIFILRIQVRTYKDKIFDGWEVHPVLQYDWSLWKVITSIFWPITIVILLIVLFIENIVEC